MMQRMLIVTLVIALPVMGCNSPGERLNAPPHGRACKTSDMQGTYAYMTDNALLADMSINDSHFLPHRDLLNDLGTQRLYRLVALMDAYGGTIRFDTALTEEELIARRMKVVMDFLCEAGLDTTQEVLVRDMSGGQGMPAGEAILIKVKEGTYSADKKGSSAGDVQTPSAK